MKISLHAPKFTGNEIKYVNECIRTSWLSPAGKFVSVFEKEIAKYTKSKFAIACINGTAALHLSLKLAGVNSNDEVIAPTITFIAPVNAIKYNGAHPIFMDCDQLGNLDVYKTIEFIKNNTYFKNGFTFNKKTNKKISALIAVHVYGNAIDLEKLVGICKKRNIKIIEDSSESLGSFFSKGKFKDKHTGTVGFTGCLSFNFNKVITSGGGGMILTNDKKIALRAKYLADQAKDDTIKFVHNSVGYNFRLGNINAAIGLAQFENLKEILRKKKEIYKIYLNYLKHNKNVIFVKQPEHSNNNIWLNLIKIKNTKKFNLKKLIKKFLSKKIEVRPVWKCNHLQKPFSQAQKFKIKKAPILVNNYLCLPSSYFLNKNEILKICNLINE